MKNIVWIIFILCFGSSYVYCQNSVMVTVLDTAGQKLPNVVLKVRETGKNYRSDDKGQILLSLPDGNFTLFFSQMGMVTKMLAIAVPKDNELVIQMKQSRVVLSEVTVNTGYQNVSARSTTGSFQKVDETLFNRRVGTDVLSRLEDIVPGLAFNKNPGSGENNISIRGQSTLFANSRPLIILDNFPYEGEIQNLNPNDVESITVLKDAAASAIWGVRAGNGVIVITTKKGRYGQGNVLQFNQNITIGHRPDLNPVPQMGVSDYIDTEIRLFNNGFYRNAELSASRTALSPVVELMIAARDGRIGPVSLETEIAQLKSQNLRQQQSKYLYRPSLNWQNSLNLKGGEQNHHYLYSIGYDKNRSSAVGNGYQRLTFRGDHTLSFLHKKLELSLGILFSDTKQLMNSLSSTELSLPYAQLADGAGNPLPVIRDIRKDFAAGSGMMGLLSWQYIPLVDQKLRDHTVNIQDYQTTARAEYRFNNNLKASINYLYGQGRNISLDVKNADSYFVRNMVNSFTQKDASGNISRPVPLGAIRNEDNSLYVNHNLRAQISYQNIWKNEHSLNAITGYEIKDLRRDFHSDRLYGFDTNNLTSSLVDYLTLYPNFINPASVNAIPYVNGQRQLTDRFVSYFSNISYGFKDKYFLSGSARFDQSNLFGVNTNQKGVPLWSAGLSWIASREPILENSWIELLKLSATYGYSGNIDKSLSAFTTARYSDGNGTVVRQPFADVTNPPNPELRWERISIANLRMDFGLRGNSFSGSVEYYFKKGVDLIGSTPFAPSTGVTVFKGNTANIAGKGAEVQLNSLNINGKFRWRTNLIYSFAKDRVTKYLSKVDINSLLQYGDGLLVLPLEGRPLYALYSYQWGGLDPVNGDPMGYVNGQSSKNYAAIRSSSTVENIIYNGPARPTHFGAIRNEFTYGNLSFSVSVNYRFGYFFRNNSISYGTTYGLGGHGDYYKRWQEQGDELKTFVPSIPTVANNNRDLFYKFSSVLVERGDHIRLQDINLNYRMNKTDFKFLPFKSIDFYSYVNNIGVLWRANKSGVDPDYLFGEPVRTVAFGIRVVL